MGERGLFAPAFLVTRPALTGFVPQPSHLIFGTSSYESTRRRLLDEWLQSERRAARVSPPARGEGNSGGHELTRQGWLRSSAR